MQQVNKNQEMSLKSQSFGLQTEFHEQTMDYASVEKPYMMSYSKASALFGGLALIAAYVSLFVIGLAA